MSRCLHTISPDAQQPALPACHACGAPGVVWHTDGRIHCAGCLFGRVHADEVTDVTDGATQTRFMLLLALLPAAVGLHIARLQALSDAEFQDRCREWTNAALLEADGLFTEVLPTGSGEKGQTASVFNALARSLAALAFVPGGVPFGNLRWEARRGTRGGSDDSSSND